MWTTRGNRILENNSSRRNRQRISTLYGVIIIRQMFGGKKVPKRIPWGEKRWENVDETRFNVLRYIVLKRNDPSVRIKYNIIL